MKIKFLLITILSMVLIGCAAPLRMLLKDGRTIEAKDEPEFNEKTGFYEIETPEGRKVKLNKDEVIEIREK